MVEPTDSYLAQNAQPKAIGNEMIDHAIKP